MSDEAAQTSLDALLARLVEETLTPAEMRELEARLTASAEARRRYVRYLDLHADLKVRGVAVESMAASHLQRPGRRPSAWLSPWALAAAACAVLALWLAAARWRAPAPVATVANVQGAVTFARAGSLGHAVREGECVPPGALRTEDASATAELIFADGTRLTLGGGTVLLFGDGPPRLLELERGSFTATVSPQPAGRPMVVRTATAEMQVLGTTFSLSTEPERTTLDVEEGRVRLRRLVDGRTVEVGASERASASLVVEDFAVAATAPPSARWLRRFDAPPAHLKAGSWLPPAEGLAGRLRASDYVAGKKPGGELIVFSGIGVQDTENAARGFAKLEAASVLRVRYRVAREAPLICFVGCRTEKGGWGGNFELSWRTIDTSPGADGWRVAEVPLSRARAIYPAYHPSSSGRLAALLIVHSLHTDVGLEIAELEIAAP